jgi:rhodanese-related sulfurtransferase
MTTNMASEQRPVGLVSPQEASHVACDCLLLDVRTPMEYRAKHVAGSVLHPLSDLDPSRVSGMLDGKRGCVVVCRSGGRARQAAEKLRAAGVGPVRVLEGGVVAWEQAGLPLNRGAAVISLERQVRIAAGLLVLCGSLLAWFVHPGWVALAGFVGAGLVFAGVTDTCGMGLLLARMPWNSGRSCGTSCSK